MSIASKQCFQAMLEHCLSMCASNAPSMCTYVTDGTNEELLTLGSYLTLGNARGGAAQNA